MEYFADLPRKIQPEHFTARFNGRSLGVPQRNSKYLQLVIFNLLVHCVNLSLFARSFKGHLVFSAVWYCFLNCGSFTQTSVVLPGAQTSTIQATSQSTYSIWGGVFVPGNHRIVWVIKNPVYHRKPNWCSCSLEATVQAANPGKSRA